LSFNPGQPSYGFTSPLWLFVIAGGVKCGVDPSLAAKAVDLLCASFSLVVMFFLLHEMVRDTAAALCATACFSFSGWFLRWAGTGMETSLAVLLLLSVFLFIMRNQYLLATVLLALLTLTRPECALLVPFLLFDLVINSHSRRYAYNMAGALVLVYFALLLPWYLIAWSTFGSLLPNTAAAKAGFPASWPDFVSTARGIAGTVGSTDLIIFLMVIAGAVVIGREYRWGQPVGDERTAVRFFLLRQTILCAGWCTVLAGLYIAADVNVVSRYLLLMIPVTIALGFSAVSWALLNSSWKQFRTAILVAFMMLSIGENQIVYRAYILPGVRKFEEGMETCLLPIGEWFRGNVKPGTVVLTGDIGAIGYFGNVSIWDVAGLITPQALPLLHAGHLPYDIIKKKMYDGLVEPAFIVDRSLEPERLKNDSLLVPVMTRPFSAMTLTNGETYYYTIYRVVRAEEFAHTAGK
jgi:hypothetical protein